MRRLSLGRHGIAAFAALIASGAGCASLLGLDTVTANDDGGGGSGGRGDDGGAAESDAARASRGDATVEPDDAGDDATAPSEDSSDDSSASDAGSACGAGPNARGAACTVPFEISATQIASNACCVTTTGGTVLRGSDAGPVLIATATANSGQQVVSFTIADPAGALPYACTMHGFIASPSDSSCSAYVADAVPDAAAGNSSFIWVVGSDLGATNEQAHPALPVESIDLGFSVFAVTPPLLQINVVGSDAEGTFVDGSVVSTMLYPQAFDFGAVSSGCPVTVSIASVHCDKL